MPLFQESHGFNATGAFVDGPAVVTINNFEASTIGRKITSGIDALLKKSLPQAIHDSSAREPARCHPGTREEHIRNITSWGKSEWATQNSRVLWLHGPAGVGKSALAQSCVDTIGDGIAATFFFSRPNRWNRPQSFIPTIAYQLATRHEAYRGIINSIVLRDPLVLEKSFAVQYRELMIKPLAEIGSEGHWGNLQDNVIVIDGLDECDGYDPQSVLIATIIDSVHQGTTPFLWAIFSRPEPHIVAAFSSEVASQRTWQLTLPVSREIDKDIEAYLRDSFGMIRIKYSLPRMLNWPLEKDIRQLVDMSAGLFIYSATVIRYIGQSESPLGPEERLQAVLDLGAPGSARPFSNLDVFYILIMKQIPAAILPNTLALLCSYMHTAWWAAEPILAYCSLLNLSLSAFYAAINSLHSVLEVRRHENGMPCYFSFVHASFGDFLQDVNRSTPEFCIDTPNVYQFCLAENVKMLRRLSSYNPSNLADIHPWSPSNSDFTKSDCFSLSVVHLFVLAELADIEVSILEDLSLVRWNVLLEHVHKAGWTIADTRVREFYRKIPAEWRSKTIRVYQPSRSHTQRPTFLGSARSTEVKLATVYLLGSGLNEAVLQPTANDRYWLLEKSWAQSHWQVWDE